MKVWIGWLVLGLCAWGTHRQVPTWSSDLALWTQAATVRPLAPRPAVNLSAHEVVEGRFDEARWWIAHTRRLVSAPDRAKERAVVLSILDRQETWIDAFSASR